MKTPTKIGVLVLCIILALYVTFLMVSRPNLSRDQVEAIAALVLLDERKSLEPIDEPRFDRKSGTWICGTSTLVMHGSICIQIRDRDRYFRVFGCYQSPRIPEFKMSPNLRQRILEIAPYSK